MRIDLEQLSRQELEKIVADRCARYGAVSQVVTCKTTNTRLHLPAWSCLIHRKHSRCSAASADRSSTTRYSSDWNSNRRNVASPYLTLMISHSKELFNAKTYTSSRNTRRTRQ